MSIPNPLQCPRAAGGLCPSYGAPSLALRYSLLSQTPWRKAYLLTSFAHCRRRCKKSCDWPERRRLWLFWQRTKRIWRAKAAPRPWQIREIVWETTPNICIGTVRGNLDSRGSIMTSDTAVCAHLTDCWLCGCVSANKCRSLGSPSASASASEPASAAEQIEIDGCQLLRCEDPQIYGSVPSRWVTSVQTTTVSGVFSAAFIIVGAACLPIRRVYLPCPAICMASWRVFPANALDLARLPIYMCIDI